MENLDTKVDEKLDAFRSWFARRISRLDEKQRRRAGGVCLLADVKPKSLDDLPFKMSGKRRGFCQSSKTITVSTDGAVLTSGKRRGRDRGPGGWGYVVHESGQTESGSCSDATNNQMELLAVLKAIHSLPKDKSIKIRTDSQYVAQTFKNGDTVRNNLNLWSELREIASVRAIKLVWVKGHAGDEHNELADRLANEAAKQLKRSM